MTFPARRRRVPRPAGPASAGRRAIGRSALHVMRRAPMATRRWWRERDGVVLVAGLLIVVMVLAFIAIADEVSEGETQHIDVAVLEMLRRSDDPEVPIGPLWLVSAAQDVSALGNRPLLIATVLIVIGYLALERMYGAMWLVAVAASGGGLLNAVLKFLFARERPDVVPHLVPVTSLSFPSGHSVLAAVMYLTLGALLARVAVHRRTRLYVLTVAMLATFLVGVSRVYLGVHYPSDVLAGWCVGLAWALLCWIVARSLQRRGAVETGPRV